MGIEKEITRPIADICKPRFFLMMQAIFISQYLEEIIYFFLPTHGLVKYQEIFFPPIYDLIILICQMIDEWITDGPLRQARRHRGGRFSSITCRRFLFATINIL